MSLNNWSDWAKLLLSETEKLWDAIKDLNSVKQDNAIGQEKINTIQKQIGELQKSHEDIPVLKNKIDLIIKILVAQLTVCTGVAVYIITKVLGKVGL